MRARDPDYDALRRALRAAIVLPIAAAVSFAVGGGSQTPLFTIFGSVALLIMVDFPGNRPARALAYCGLGFNGAVLITLGTLVAPHPWVTVALMFVLGVAVTFAGVLSEIVAAGQRATLLMFVLPACTPVGPIDERLLGWLIALAICVPAALFLLPPRHHDELRANAARVCNRLADRLEGGAGSERAATKAMNALYENFLGADYRPVGLTAGSRALVRVVDDLGWLADQISDDTGRLLGAMRDPALRVLRDSAAVLRLRSVADRAARSADLRDALLELRSVAQARYREDIAELLGESSDEAAIAVGRELLNVRTIAATIAVTGRVIRNAAAADARPVWARVLGRRLPDTGAADRVMPETVAVAAITKGFLATKAVVLRNSLRTGLGLALAVAVTHVFPGRARVLGGARCDVGAAQQCADHRNPGATGGGGHRRGFRLGCSGHRAAWRGSRCAVDNSADCGLRFGLRARGWVVRRRPGRVHDDGVDQLQSDRADRLASGIDPRRGRRGRSHGGHRGVGPAVAAGCHGSGVQGDRGSPCGRRANS